MPQKDGNGKNDQGLDNTLDISSFYRKTPLPTVVSKIDMAGSKRIIESSVAPIRQVILLPVLSPIGLPLSHYILATSIFV